MIVLLNGIYTLFAATVEEAHNAFYTVVGGRMYPHEAPQGATFPYATVRLITNTPDYVFDQEHTEDCLVQFSIFTEDSSEYDSLAAVGTIYSALVALLDDASLTVSGFTSLSMQRETANLVRDEEERTWNYYIDYRIILE